MPYTFALPEISDLSRGQRIALTVQTPGVFIISGCPGSGKTTVAMLRAKGKGDNRLHHYTVWANMLYGYLLNVAPKLGVSESHFSTFFSWFYMTYRTFAFGRNGVNIDVVVGQLEGSQQTFEEFQLDEGQDLPLEIRCAIANIAKKYVICMDPAQDVKGICDVKDDEIQKTINLLEHNGNTVQSFVLTRNWRNTQPIFSFSKSIVPELNSQIDVSDFAKNSGPKPSYYELEGADAIADKIYEIISNEPGRNIGIFDDSLHRLGELNIKLKAKGVITTIYNNRDHKNRLKSEKIAFLKSMSNVVLCTFISCKGLEFNTVIIPDVSSLDDRLKIKKGYYVGCTRAQDRLILFKDNSVMQLPNWFQQIDSNLYEKMSIKDNISII